MQVYEVLQETDTLELVAMVKAESLEDAKEMAITLGYGKGYRVEEAEDM